MIVLLKKNNFANRHDRKPFSRTKRRNQIGSNGRRMKSNDDEHFHEEDPVKKGEANTEFIKKHNLLENSHLKDWLKDFLANKLARTCECITDLWTACFSMKRLLSNT